MAAFAAKMMMKNAGKMGKLASKAGNLQSRLGIGGGGGGGMAAAAGGGAAAGAVMGVPGIPSGPGMQPSMGGAVAPERIYIGPIHKRIYWPGTRGDPEPPLPEAPAPQWTPASVTTSFSGMATAAAVTGGGVIVAAKAPGLFAVWAPTVILIIGVLIIVGLLLYYSFFHKSKVEKDAEQVGDDSKKAGDAVKGEARKLK